MSKKEQLNDEQQPSVSESAPQAPANELKGNVPWKRANKGIPVEKGKNWVTGLSHEQRVLAMNNHEQFWKKRYNAQRGTVGLQQNWTRG